MSVPASKPEARSSLLLLDWIGIAGCAVILLWAAWAGYQALALIAALFVAIAGGARLWSRSALWRVSYARKVGERRAFPDDEIELTLSLTNAKLIPVPWLGLSEQIPGDLRPDSENWVPSDDTHQGSLIHTTSLLWYRRISWRYQLRCRHRGCYQLGPTKVSGGDPFGLFVREQTFPADDEIVVYPRIWPIERIEMLAGRPLGEVNAGSAIYEDPSRTVGIREYQPSDALKRINWKASARRQQLQVRVYEPTTAVQQMLVLGLEGFSNEQPEDDERFERAVSAIASLASHAVTQRQAVGLLINGGIGSAAQGICLQPGAGQDDLMRILEILARLEPRPMRPLPEFLLEDNAAVHANATYAIVTGHVDKTLVESIHQLRRQGRKAYICAIDGEWEGLDGLGVPVQGLVFGNNVQ
jgi:uncharacterized protein (DUF58 family)